MPLTFSSATAQCDTQLFPHPKFTVGGIPFFATTGEFNGDGLTDLLTIDVASDDISVLLGKGDGTFEDQLRSDSEDLPSGQFLPFTTGDFNGDGMTDLAMTTRDSDGVSVRLSIGDGTFTDQQTFTTASRPTLVIAGDFNGEGLTDLASASPDSNEVSILLGNGDGTFGNPNTFVFDPVVPGFEFLGIIPGEFNGDGMTDLATVFETNIFDSVAVLLNSGDGKFAPQQAFEVGNNIRSLTSSDFNGDGLDDLAALRPIQGEVLVMLGNGDGTFADQQNFATGSTPTWLALGDLNNDSVTDLAIARQNVDVSVLLGIGDGSFEDLQTSPSGGRANSIALGDFNGDGLTDLAGTALYDRNVFVQTGFGDGTFANQPTFETGDSPVSITTADFNGDGMPDLATANNRSDDVSVVLGNGDGTFLNRQTFTAGIFPSSITNGDFNGDGITDLATANSGNFNGSSVSVLLGNGDGTFTDHQTFATENGPVSIATGDFNGDGLTDLATANEFSSKLSVLFGVGDGTFLNQQTVDVGDQSFLVATGDFNGDGLTDLAAAVGYADDVVVLLLSNGDGTFDNRQTFTAPGVPRFVATGDYNGDGLTDLATATSSTLCGMVSVLLGNGDGTFEDQQTFEVGSPPLSITTGDFNSDGVVDLATGNSCGVSVLLGLGNGVFDDHQTFLNLDFATSIAAGDFNGDGLDDLATAYPGNASTGGVSILLNQLGIGIATVAPSTFTVSRGIQIGGTLSDAIESDDSRLLFNPGFTLNSTEPPVWLTFDGSLGSDSPSSLEILMESQAGTPGLTGTLEVFNWSSSAYDVIDVSAASFNTDTVVTTDLSSGISDYVENGTSAVRSRIGWRQTGFTLNFPWEVRLDQLVWTVD